MITQQDLSHVIGGTAIGEDGDRLGKIGQIYLDDRTGEPEWATISTGLFGTHESFVPLEEADVAGDDLRFPYDKETVKGAPRVTAEQDHLSEAEEAELYRYYGLDQAGGEAGRDFSGTAPAAEGSRTGTAGTAGEVPGAGQGRSAAAEGAAAEGAVGRDTSGPTTDDAMTRSEEQIRVGTERVQSGRAHLRKYVVTENVTRTVPVSHEEVRVEREPITDANRDRAMAGPDISEEEHEVILHEERPVVAKETVPVERVRLDTETVTEEQTVSDEVRKEQIETGGIETDEGTGGRKP